MNSDNYQILEISPKKQKVRLSQLAERLNVKPIVLSSILREAGFAVYGSPTNFLLNENHLKVISKVYSKSVKAFFNRTKKSIDKVSEREKLKLFNSFKLFVLKPESFDENSIYSGDLEVGLIEKYFFSIVSSINYGLWGEVVKNYLQVKIRLLKTFIEQKRKTISTFINYCYYNFSIDEDSERSTLICFS
jgi:hypothetical protein